MQPCLTNETPSLNKNPSQTPYPNISSSFNPLTHFPPKFDILGQIKKQPNHSVSNRYNILAEKDSIKIPWATSSNSPGSPMTQQKLFERRKLERIPDISYDLDKDGYVGGKDFVLAKRYDLDCDGKLNEAEKKAAYEGIAQNVESNYVWNLDNQGGNRAFRIMQRRGKIIDAEDFLPLSDTYPQHPLSKIEPKNGVKTLTELRKYRLNQTKDDVNKKIKLWEEKNPQSYIAEPLAVNNSVKPLHSSVNEIKSFKHRNARVLAGLSEYENDIKITDKDPSLKYVYDPVHKTTQDLHNEIQKENLEQSKKLSMSHHKNDVERLKAREDEVFARLYSNEDRKTYSKIKEARQKELFDYNLKTFSTHAIGVHGQELPKFAEDEKMKEFWRFKEGYCDNPDINSYTEFNEKIKYWKKPEDLLLTEHRDEIPQPDDFKREHFPKEVVKKDEKLIIKVNHVNFYKDFDPTQQRPLDMEKANKNHIYRWSTLSAQFAPQKFKNKRFFDSLPDSIPEENDNYAGQYNNNNAVFNQKDIKEEKVLQDLERSKSPNDQTVSTKDSLFQRFSTKDSNKLTKSTAIRTKGF